MPTHPADRSVVVVGAGLAGARTVAALRAGGHRGRLVVLGAEGLAPYDRPPLSKELFSRTEPAWLSGELGIDLPRLADDVRLADPALALSPAAAGWQVTTASGEVGADDVVLAVGARPLRPWPEAGVLRTAADAATLRGRLRGARLAVVGAGWIGAEVAGVAAGVGARVTVVEAGATPLLRQLGAGVGRHTTGWYAAAGVDLRLGVGVDALAETADGTRVELGDGTRLDTDLVLAAVGARPATHWLRGVVALDAGGSVPTDAAGRVLGHDGGPGPGGLWAVGDCATRHHPTFGPVPGGHWSAALHDPEQVAAALLGLPLPPTPAPYVFSQQLGHDLALFGLPRAGDDVVFRGDPTTAGSWLALYLDAGVGTADGTALVRAVLAVDSPREVSPLRRLLATGPARVDLGAALDPASKLRDAVV